MTDALFKHATEALAFAYKFSSQQYDRPLMNRMADKGTRTGKGLAGMDGAAQAGFIRREVKTLGELQEAIVIASFSPPTSPCACRATCCSGTIANKEWSDAIYVITMAAMEKLAGKMSHYQLRRGIVERQFGVKHSLADLAELCRVNRDTASDHNAIITAWLTGDKKRSGPNVRVGEIFRAISAAGDRLYSSGMIGDFEDSENSTKQCA